MERTRRRAPTICALLGLGLVTAGCGGSHAGAAINQHPTPTTSGSSLATSASSAAATTSPSADASPASPPASPAPGVVADCVKAPQALSTQPSAIVLACADDGLGVEKMRWTSWTASAATGQGTLWENLCKPDCAAGKIGTYPVTITLSGVKTSPRGPWFSLMMVTWEGTRPPNQTPDNLPLPSPIP